MAIRFVLWDNDGVLVDTEGAYFRATQRALAECGVMLDLDRYARLRARGESAWRLAEDANVHPEHIAHHRAARDTYYQDFLRGGSVEIEGVRPVLAALGQRYRMAVVTTSKRTDFELIHHERHLVRHMQFVLTREDFAKEKPAPDGYLAALARFGADPHEAVVVEDSEQGLNAARAAGIRCVIVRNAFFGDVHDFKDASRILGSVRELPDAIGRLDRD
jgi:HAD superfamily hydrolase (TIGR01509 family)